MVENNNEAMLQNLKESIEQEKSKVQALTEENEKLKKSLEEKEKENKELIISNTNLRSVNGKLLLQQTGDTNEEGEKINEAPKTLEESVAEILSKKE